MPKTLRNRQARKCCVGPCQNAPLKGRKTCGQHGKRSAVKPVKAKAVRADRVLNTWREFYSSTSVGPISIKPLPTETRYIADVALRSDGSFIGLPTTPDGFKRLLASWLMRPGCTLADVERLTPAALPRIDRGAVICQAAAQLVKFDLARGAM